jgi:hypothetical protein
MLLTTAVAMRMTVVYLIGMMTMMMFSSAAVAGPGLTKQTAAAPVQQ